MGKGVIYGRRESNAPGTLLDSAAANLNPKGQTPRQKLQYSCSLLQKNNINHKGL